VTVQESIEHFGAVATAVIIVRQMADRIDDDGRLVIEGADADDLSIVAFALGDVLSRPDGT